MKKIMFNDKYGLTKAVLEGRKTMTRRIVSEKMLACANDYVQKVHGTGHDSLDYLLAHSLFKIGEVVAVAQSYKDCGYDPGMLQQTYVKKPTIFPELDPYSKHVGWIDLPLKYHKGWINKMFVLAGLMPHQIRITNVRVERLQDISDEDCLREGVINYTCNLYEYQGTCYSFVGDKSCMGTYKTPQQAFAALIDKISGKGTWESNPWVFVYEYERVK